MIEKIYKTIKEYGLIEKKDKIIIGLSGGADSMCLTHILYCLREEMELELMCAHMHHSIRGEEADYDAQAARKFSESLGIPFEFLKEDVPSYAKRKGISEELAGRELRYAFFENSLQKYGFNKIATAHNKNDNAETILMNFLRGSGIKGLGGIPYKRDKIIRPILDCTREEIEAYCAKNGINYVIDSTNAKNLYTRNKIRNELIPRISESFNPNFINTVTENAALISADCELLNDIATDFYNKEVKDGKVDITMLLSQPVSVRNRVIFEMMSNALHTKTDLSSSFVNDITELAQKCKSGSYIMLPKEIIARIEYGKLYIGKQNLTENFEYEIPLNTEVYIKEMNKTVYAQYVSEKDGEGIYLEAEKDDKIILRNRREGDVFHPVGMNGRKKVKDFFIDKKIPAGERTRIGIITINGEIADIIGKRSDRRYTFIQKGFKITIK